MSLISIQWVLVAVIAGAGLITGGAVGPSSAQNGTPQSALVSLDDQGIFLLSFAGKLIGSEKFNIRSSPYKIEADAEIQLKVEQDGKTVEVQASPKLVLNNLLEPLTYSLDEKGSQTFHLTVDFRSTPAKSQLLLAGSNQADERDFTLPKDVAVLDDNVIHHYQFLVYRFLHQSAKKITFNAYIPQEAAPGVVTIEEAGTEVVTIDGHKETLRHLILSTELVQIGLGVDAQFHLVHVYNPVLQIEAIRKE